MLEVRKQAGTNTLDVINSIKARITELQKSMPPDFRVTYTRDQSKFISDSFHAVQEHLDPRRHLRRAASCFCSSGIGARR